MNDIQKCVEQALDTRMAPLREEIQYLREKLRSCRRVITHKEATAYFDEDVKPHTIIEYIHYRGLPAFKNGRKWFIYLEDLMDWQIGAIGFAEKLEKPRVFSPRHKRDLQQITLFGAGSSAA